MKKKKCPPTERSRQSARECRARKKLRYQYLEDLAAGREKAVQALYREMEQVSPLPIPGGPRRGQGEGRAGLVQGDGAGGGLFFSIEIKLFFF